MLTLPYGIIRILDRQCRQVKGFPGAIYKGFATRVEAERWQRGFDSGSSPASRPAPAGPTQSQKIADQPLSEEAVLLAAGKVVLYTDGGALRNPGPGGYGVVLKYQGHRKELSGGFRLTTNNRMELCACIIGLQTLNRSSEVVIFSDSKYVVNGISKGWARRWRSRGWMRTKTDKAENADLWARLLELCETHRVEFRWVKGHAGHAENERCDRLAVGAAQAKDLPPDPGYEGQ